MVLCESVSKLYHDLQNSNFLGEDLSGFSVVICIVNSLNFILGCTDNFGYATTHFGKVRRIKSTFGYAVKAAPNLKCKVDDVLFVMRGMIVVKEDERDEWDGYDFQWDDEEVRRPNHSFDSNYLHPPMMVNTHCVERGELPNLALFTEDDVVIFKVTRPIQGHDILLVDYGHKYNQELLEERAAARLKHLSELMSRGNKQHNFKCVKCGHTCHQRFRVRHYKQCLGEDT